MNDPSETNGIIEGWFDGEKALDVRDISFRYTDSFAIDKFQFSTFFGGQGDSRAQKDEYAYFDDFIISTEPVRSQQMTCSELNGVPCSAGQICQGGSFQYSTDHGNLCCVEGICYTEPETCQNQGYNCCDECEPSTGQSQFDSDCPGQVCCEICNRSTIFSTSDSYLGNALNWEPLTPSRWDVISDEGDMRYGIMTTGFSQLSGNRLGEYSLIRNMDYENFNFTAKVRSTEDFSSNNFADYCVVFGYQDNDNYYYMMFNSDLISSELFKIVEGMQESIARASNLIIPDNAYHSIRIERVGDSIMTFFDHTPVLETTDTTYSSGRVGIGGYNDASLWDDIIIESVLECHDADLNCDGTISLTELIDYINRWKAGDVSLQNVMGAIVAWKG